jgi:3-phenylpropionate/trans-cinnamate dioxygenase ferredoxin reductase subunit
LESVQNTSAHAQTILAQLAGQPIPEPAVPWFWSTQYEARLQIAGLNPDYDQLIARGQDTQARSWLYLKQGRLVACDAINRPADFLQAKKMIMTETQIDIPKAEDINIPLSQCIA